MDRLLPYNSRLRAWRNQYPSAYRIGFWYSLAAVSLPLLWLAALGLAPEAGLTRSYWYSVDASTEPIIEERITAIDLAFIDERYRPTRNYRVRWEGVWFSPRAERVDFYAGADDGVTIRVDGDTVLERSPAVGMHTVARTVELGAGAHRLEIEHWQDGGGRSLNVQWGHAGGPPALLGSTRLFPEDPGVLGYWLRFAAVRFPVLILWMWTTGVAALVGLTIGRAFYWKVTNLSPTEHGNRLLSQLLLSGRAFYRSVTSMSPAERWRRLRTVLFPAVLGPSQLLLFGPWTVHETNRAEFLVGFWELAPGWVWLLGPVVGVLAGLSILMPARWFPRYVAALCAVGVLLWAQGNLLLADYGLLDGGGLDLASHAWRAPFEAGLWVCVLLLAVVFANRFAHVAPVACAALVTLQATVLVAPVARMVNADAPSTPGAETGWQVPPPEIYELSTTRNLIHIVLDGFPARTFVNILNTDRPAFDHDWSGFTFFADHLGAHRNTNAAMIAMLSGIPYRNELPFREFVARHPSVFHTLGQQGYQLRSVTSHVFNHPNPAFPGVDDAILYSIPSPYGSYRDYVDIASAKLLDLSLFRHAPQTFKPDIYRGGRWFLQDRSAAAATARRPYGDTMFLREFASRLTPGDEAPAYTLIHVYTPHLPLVNNADCTYAVRSMPVSEHFANQAQCALSSVRLLLDRLRDLDLYDRSAIIVTADHGIEPTYIQPEEEHPLRGIESPARMTLPGVESRATPLLLVKPFASDGPLQTSYAPTAITDVPATLLDLVGLPNALGRGASVLRIDPAEPRQRTYAHQDPKTRPDPFLDALYVFDVDGRVDDPDAWSYHRTVFEPTDDRAAQRRENQIGLFADPHGTADEGGARTYRTDGYAVFYAVAEDSRVAFDVRRMPAIATTQTVTVRIDGDIVDQHVLADDAWYTLSYPVEARSEDSPFCIELLTSPAGDDATGEPRGLMLRGEI